MYEFPYSLYQGIITDRTSRFGMYVTIGNETHYCHCPVTGRIGSIVFDDIDCLVSPCMNPERKTPFTVEAISLTDFSEMDMEWIGINQREINTYVKHFLNENAFPDMIKVKPGTVIPEQWAGESRLDFKIEDTYLEVKLPLNNLQTAHGSHVKTKNMSKFKDFERLVKHLNDLKIASLQGRRAILLVCFLYDNLGFNFGLQGNYNIYMANDVYDAINSGVEIWQANFRVDEDGVDLDRYAEITDYIADGNLWN